MIIPTMNSEELVREIIKDYPMVLRKGEYALKDLRRPALKSKNKHVQKIYDYESKNKNKWMIFCDYHVNDPFWFIVVHFVNKSGLQAYLVDENKRVLYHYSGHFLDRFNERFLYEPGLSKIEILKRYLSKNASTFIEVHPESDKYKHPVFGRAKEGVVFGNVVLQGIWSIINVRTFISNNMIREGQQDRFDATSDLYKKYWDEVYKKRSQNAFDN
jgi:hypothetical protein